MTLYRIQNLLSLYILFMLSIFVVALYHGTFFVLLFFTVMFCYSAYAFFLYISLGSRKALYAYFHDKANLSVRDLNYWYAMVQGGAIFTGVFLFYFQPVLWFAYLYEFIFLP